MPTPTADDRDVDTPAERGLTFLMLDRRPNIWNERMDKTRTGEALVAA
jgi:hypothetical protein